jgi:hypothetical protein
VRQTHGDKTRQKSVGFLVESENQSQASHRVAAMSHKEEKKNNTRVRELDVSLPGGLSSSAISATDEIAFGNKPDRAAEARISRTYSLPQNSLRTRERSLPRCAPSSKKDVERLPTH